MSSTNSKPSDGIKSILAKVTKAVPITSSGVVTDVDIDLNAGGLKTYLESLAEALFTQYSTEKPEVRNIVDADGEPVEEQVSLLEMLMAYFQTLLVYRVLYVRRELHGAGNPFSYRMEDLNLAITPYISAIFENIGRVDAVDKGVTLLPKIKYTHVLDETTMRRYSRRISALLNTIHITFVKELPKSREGSFELMSMQIINGVVWNETRDEANALYALMAATLNLKQVQAVIGARVSYADVSYLLTLLPGVVDYECAQC